MDSWNTVIEKKEQTAANRVRIEKALSRIIVKSSLSSPLL